MPLPSKSADPLVELGHTQPDNLVYRCRLLSVWRDGPFITLVIPTQHSRATLTAKESRDFVLALNGARPKLRRGKGKKVPV